MWSGLEQLFTSVLDWIFGNSLESCLDLQYIYQFCVFGSQEEFLHWFIPQEGIISSYVVVVNTFVVVVVVCCCVLLLLFFFAVVCCCCLLLLLFVVIVVCLLLLLFVVVVVCCYSCCCCCCDTGPSDWKHNQANHGVGPANKTFLFKEKLENLFQLKCS